jgi:DNA-binding transcriptional regulator LsrR (DeoR family)
MTAADRAGRATRLYDADYVSHDHLRLLTRVARLYHEHGVRQPQIAAQLHVSQPRVSRLLKQAVELGIVRTTVIAPPGVHGELEETIEARYGLQEVVVVDTHGATDEQHILPALGSAAATYLETTLTGGDRIGISSWSATLLATVDAMRPGPTPAAAQVVQLLGGVGVATAQTHATRLTGRLAQLTGADALYLPAPGLVAAAATREAVATDPSTESVFRAFEDLTMVLVGVGSLEPSRLLRDSGNAIAVDDQEALRQLGAVGDICLRFFDQRGEHVDSSLDDRVIGITHEVLRAVPRRVAVAGGKRKYTAIRAALRGGWLNVLVTDLVVAQRLINDADAT